MSRRSFLKEIATLAGTTAGGTLLSMPSFPGLPQLGPAQEPAGSSDHPPVSEDFWHQVRQAYTVSPTMVNLNNGGVSPQPKAVQEAVERFHALSNEAPSYYMWRVLDQGREPLRRQLAALAGCSPEELAIQRNSSEALETVIFGLPLERGDEVVLSRQDYPNMINAWKQREMRDGIVLRWVDLPLPAETPDTLAEHYLAAFGARTKVVHITHMINWNGQLLPVRRIADAAKARGIEVLVDAAHTFAHITYSIPELNCDYFGTSLHKWLCAPFGTGLLYVRQEKIASLYPLLAAPDPKSGDIRKFENLGTRSFAIEQGIGQAILFHELIGGARKMERLQYLKTYWTSRVAEWPEVSFGSPLDASASCAIALLQVAGKTPAEVSSRLFDRYKIHTVAIDWENIHGVRITPNVYTTRSELDTLVEAIGSLCGR